MEGDRGGETGRYSKGVQGVREVGEEGAGSGIPKVAGSGRKRENIMQHCAIFCNGLENALCLLSEIENAFQSTF